MNAQCAWCICLGPHNSMVTFNLPVIHMVAVVANDFICDIYIATFAPYACQLICICVMYVAFNGHIGCKRNVADVFWVMCEVMWGLFIHYRSRATGHVWSVAVIFIQEYMPIQWSVCIPVLLVTFLTVSLHEVCILTFSTHACTWSNLLVWHIKDMFVVDTHMAITW